MVREDSALLQSRLKNFKKAIRKKQAEKEAEQQCKQLKRKQKRLEAKEKEDHQVWLKQIRDMNEDHDSDSDYWDW